MAAQEFSCWCARQFGSVLDLPGEFIDGDVLFVVENREKTAAVYGVGTQEKEIL